MKPRNLFIYILAVLSLVPLGRTFAQQPAITIEVLAAFDYPGTGNSTTPFGINNRGDVSGRYLDTSGVTRGFIRFHNGNFSPPIAEPNDNGVLTEANDINKDRAVVGDFVGATDAAYHSFLLSDRAFTQFDVTDAASTLAQGINDLGHFVGGFITGTQPEEAFVNIDGTTTTFAIPEAIGTLANRINGMDEVVGQYTDSASVIHGFLRGADGTLTFPFDFPAPGATVLYGINNRHWIVGRYTDESAVDHGFFQMPGTFVQFDYPGAAGTSLNGINNQGIIAGRYADSAGIRHGFIGRVQHSAQE
jgi:uncharacterized membrane protein